MTRRIQITLLSLLMSVCAMASNTSVKNAEGVEIWYDFDSNTNTASVTYKGSSYSSYNDEYTGEVVIPSTVTYKGVEYSVTSIGYTAFRICTALTSITLPEGVTSIGNYAFSGCSALTSITLPEGVTSIGNYAFSGCSALTSITLPEGVTSIGGYAFYNCSALTSITLPEGVTSIGKWTFNGCYSLTSITLPEGVTSIGDRAFVNCYKLYEVYNKSDLTITAGYSDNGYVACYAKNVYSEGESKLKTMGDYIFYVDGEDIELIAYTGSEISITLPSDYEGKNYNIGDYAFYECDALTSITLPEGVTSIGYCAFYECDALTSITLPEGVTSIGNSAFCYCEALTSITIPEGVTSIGDYAFNGCYSLTSITLPEGVTSIGGYAFNGCYSLTSITIPEGVTSIGDYAFSGCYKLYEVYNKSDLTITAGSTDKGYVARYAKNVYTDSEGESKLKTVEDYIFYVDGEDIELIAYTDSETSITLPSDYEGKNYKIGYRAFYGCDSLTSITLPESLTSIGNEAFYYCSALTSITLPESLTSIGNEAFYYCSALTSITLPEGLTSIGDDAFNGCYSLTSITLPEGVTSIGGYAFRYCYRLYEVYNKSDLTITAGSTDKGYVARYAKNVYTDSEGESKLKTVEDYIFYVDGEDIELIAYTDSETSITLPSDYEGKNYNIGDYAFYDCSALTSITSKNTTPPTIGSSYTFYDVEKSIPVYVPKSSVDAYKSAEYWKDFTNIVGKYYIVDIEAENGTVEGAGAYEENEEATLTATPAEGYKFVQWSDGVTDNPRTIIVVSDMTFTAEFELKEYTLTTEAENGTVEGAGTYKHGDKATLSATPAEGYKFVQWSDGVTDNPCTVVVVSDMTFTAEFELKEYTLTTEAENGTVKGAGTYKHGAEATLTVTPAEGYKFVQWSDGVTDNPRTIEVTSDLILTAEFEIDVTPISDIQTSDVKVRLIGNEIAVEGTDDYAVYSISGQNLGKAESVERGIYIVVANGKCYKVIAK